MPSVVVKIPVIPIGKNLDRSMMEMLIASLLSTHDGGCNVFPGGTPGAFNPRLVIFIDYPGLTMR